ncbi:MAG: hypothetical protein ACOYXB_08770 [Bacteroidota bacterium]
MRTNNLFDPEEYFMDEETGDFLDDIQIEPSEELILKTLRKVTA